MSTRTIFVSAVIVGFLASPDVDGAQTTPEGDLYEIVAGHYSECCGFAGNETGYDLPQENQGFIRFGIDSAGNSASMTFLGSDARTTFGIVPCGVPDPIAFAFDQGLVFADHVVFHVDPGPPPFASSWNYTVTNTAERLSIHGTLGIVQGGCSDAPTQFGHTNVVANLVPAPTIRVNEFSKEGALLFVQGNAGWIDVVEASIDLVTWTPISTNTMPATLCPVCPYVLVRDSESTNLVRRYYRAVESPGAPVEPAGRFPPR